jgi:phage repressor protein C with HTH and peptisase S24 domain
VGVPRSTIYRAIDLTDPYIPAANTIGRIEDATGRRVGEGTNDEKEGEALEEDDWPAPVAGSFLAWRLTGRALELAGYRPGDVIFVDANLPPRRGDVVVAKYLNQPNVAPLFRLYEPPFLMTATLDPKAHDAPRYLDERVEILGTVVHLIRSRPTK